MKRIVVILSLVSLLFVGLAADTFACGPNDYACNAQQWYQAAQGWGRQFGQGAQGLGRSVQGGGFWNNYLSNPSSYNVPAVPGAGTVFGVDGSQAAKALRQFSGRR